MKHITLILALFIVSLTARASAPVSYDWSELSGSACPYPTDIRPQSRPDSLKPVMINHVGRHGARYPTSGRCSEEVRRFLMKAYEARQLTAAGKKLLALTDSVRSAAGGRWGRLDALGEAEQRGIAARMFVAAPNLFGDHAGISAISSWKPRCVMSMYSFLHQLTLLNQGGLMVTSSSGTPEDDALLRFFDTDRAYRELIFNDALLNVADRFQEKTIDDGMATAILRRLAGICFPDNVKERRWTVMAVYSLIADCGAMGIKVNPADWMTQREYKSCWSVKNFSQYMHYSASTVSDVPAAMAAPLLRDLIATTDSFLVEEKGTAVRLRFGHAETLMPLMSIMRLPGAYYVSRMYESVAAHWRNYDLVPMAANLVFHIFKAPSGIYYLRLDVNERPVAFIPGRHEIYVPWTEARDYFMRCLRGE